METTIFKLYGGKVILEKEEGKRGHSYYLVKKKERVRLLSVTGVLQVLSKPSLIPWAVKVAIDHLHVIVTNGDKVTIKDLEVAKNAHHGEKQRGADTGKDIHTWIERYLATGSKKLPDDPKVLNGVLAFLRWVEAHRVKILASERVVYSKKHGYVGTLDAIAKIDGKVSIVDFKSARGFHLDQALQVAAYRNAVEEEDGNSIFTGPNMIARFDKTDGSFHMATFEEHEEDLSAFLALLRVKRRETSSNETKYVSRYKLTLDDPAPTLE